MMSGHGPNPIFFNKKNRDGTSRTIANLPPQSGRFMIDIFHRKSVSAEF